MNSPRLPAPSARRRGFTLIELLTVIAIIGILAAILIPTIGRVRSSARQTQGLSNLRQIGTAATLYANDNRNLLPVATSAVSNYALDLNPYASQLGSKYADFSNGVRISGVFKDPVASSHTGNYHFSANPNFMPDTGSAGTAAANAARRSRNLSARPSQHVLIADGALPSDTTSATFALYGYGWLYSATSATSSTTPVERGATDATTAGKLGWRSADSNGVKCLWLDGHVTVMSQGQLMRYHFQRD